VHGEVPVGNLRGVPVADWPAEPEEIGLGAIGGAPRRLTARSGSSDPTDVGGYLAHGGYTGLRRALGGLQPQKVIDEIEASGLDGRGGAAFPTGRKWALAHGLAEAQDQARTEEGGCLEAAQPAAVSLRGKERRRLHWGTLGAGNQFLEVDAVEQVFNPAAANAMGLREGCLALEIQSGSRGFGRQVCTDFVQDLPRAVRHYHIELPARELVCVPLESPEGQA
jgi:hypothetical protein